MTLPRRHYRLWSLLGLSLLLHLAAFGLWRSHDNPLSLQFAPQTASLAVSLTAIESATSRDPTRTTQEQTVTVRKATPRARPERQSQRRVTTRNRASSTTAVVKPTNRTTKSTRPATLNRAHIIARLREDLSQHFYYPPLARRRNMEGTVLLYFDVTNEGRIEHVGVRHSSGYAILDLAAQQAMQRLARLDWLAGKLDRDRMNIELPVRYKLTES